ncbi:MAG TPA: CdaR family protein, partial [Candidatus Acidoferrales bacterium]|nr:CdaR family protein [Candidatus Acidoferrales bacterium]
MRVALPRPTWSRRFDPRGIVTHDLPLKLTALLIAIVFAIVNAQNAAPQEIVAAFDGRVPIERPEVPSGFVLQGNLGDVAVTVRGPQGVADHLSLSDFPATLDLTGVDAGQGPRDARVNVTVSDPKVKVVDVTPLTVSVRLERITSRTLAVQTRLANDPPKGMQAGQTSVSPGEVRVIGPESAV